MNLSFHNKRSFLQKIDMLPQGARWKLRKIKLEIPAEDGGTTTEELDLWARNPVRVIRELLANPRFRDKL